MQGTKRNPGITSSAFVYRFFLLVCMLACSARVLYSGTKTNPSKVVIVEFADFQCPFCARQAPDLRKLQVEYPDRLTVIFKNFPLSFHPQSKPAHLAALAAGEQGQFWGMHDLLFAHPNHLSMNDFDEYAAQLGLNEEEFHRAIRSPLLAKQIDADVQEGQKLGVTGTPTLIVDGHIVVGAQSYVSLKHIILSELAGKPWKKTESSSPQPANVDISNSPVRGQPNAPVTLIEFSDFECPYCARAVYPIKQLLDSNGGNVRWAFKNFPLEFHHDAELAHVAALAARKQGRFWQMHDLIFEQQARIKREDLISLASKLGLDTVRFSHDLEDPNLKAEIEKDKEEGLRLGINATPTFVINGEIVSGFSQTQLASLIAKANIQKPTSLVDALEPALGGALSLGPINADLHIDWYVDLSSPLAAKSAVALDQFLASRHGQVRVRFRNFVLPNHDNARLVHEFVLAAAAQGKFWNAESLLLADPSAKDEGELKKIAVALHLDQDRLWKEIGDKKYDVLIDDDIARAKESGISGSPVFVSGDKKFDGVDGLRNIP